jgi:hypothetical protein
LAEARSAAGKRRADELNVAAIIEKGGCDGTTRKRPGLTTKLLVALAVVVDERVTIEETTFKQIEDDGIVTEISLGADKASKCSPVESPFGVLRAWDDAEYHGSTTGSRNFRVCGRLRGRSLNVWGNRGCHKDISFSRSGKGTIDWKRRRRFG